jgi:hypothetical protein
MLEDLGSGPGSASVSLDSGRVEMLAGDLPAAERELRRDFDALSEMGEKFLRSTVGGLLARVVGLQGRHQEAIELSRSVEEIAADDDVDAQALWRGARARAMANLGDVAKARQLADEEVALRRRSDAPIHLSEALGDLAEVLRLGDEANGAADALTEALGLVEAKGDVVSTRQLRSLLEAVTVA